MEAFKLAGNWWLPEHPEAKVVGVLRFTREDGFELEIPFGCLGTPDDFVERVNTRRANPIVYGELQNGKAVTLVDVHCTKTTLAMPGTGREEHFASFGFVGSVHAPVNPVVDRVRLEFSRLRDWVAVHPFSWTHLAAANAGRQEIDYRYQPVDERRLAAGSEWVLSVSHSSKLPMPSVEGFNVEHDCYLTLDLTIEASLDEVNRDFLEPIWRFLCFALNQMIPQTLVEVHLAAADQWLTVGRAVLQKEQDDKVILEPFMLLSLPLLGDRAEAVLKRWLSFDGDERRAVSLLVGLGRKQHVPSDLRFLAAAQALEAMARVDAKEEELSEEEFERRLGIVKSALETDKKTRKWAARKLEYSNQRSSSELVQDLMAYIGKYVTSLVPDTPKFISDLRNNRNFYTHRDDRRAERVFDGAELHLLTEAVICLLKAAIIRRVGFTEDETAEFMDACQGILRCRIRVAEMYARAASDEA